MKDIRLSLNLNFLWGLAYTQQCKTSHTHMKIESLSERARGKPCLELRPGRRESGGEEGYVPACWHRPYRPAPKGTALLPEQYEAEQRRAPRAFRHSPGTSSPSGKK